MSTITINISHKNKIQIGPVGCEDTALMTIAGFETVDITTDNDIQEKSFYEDEGWLFRMVTGKSMTFGFTGTRIVGDPGNDFVAAAAFANGEDCNARLVWTTASGKTKLDMTSVLNVSKVAGGETKNLDPMEFEALSSRKPTITITA
jgi:hypothetical protein